MYKETPFSWSHSREITEAVRVSNGIEKIFEQILSRCDANSPSTIKCQSLEAVVSTLGIVVDSPPSHTRSYYINDSIMWQDFSRQLWEQLNPEEKQSIAPLPDFVESLTRVDNEWAAHGVPEMLQHLATAVEALRGDASREVSEGRSPVSNSTVV